MKKKTRKKEEVQSEKIQQALEADVQKGGAILKKKTRKKEEIPSLKIQQALEADVKKGGSMRFYDKRHKYLYEKLSGRGAGFDSEMCRKMIEPLLKKRHPSFYNSYMKGRKHDLPQNIADHLHNTPVPRKKESKRHITMFGGSMNALTHSENGLLRIHDSDFHQHLQIV